MWICDQHVNRIAATEGGGVIGDKVTLIFRSFSTHFLLHPLCRPFKSKAFSLGKTDVPPNEHNEPDQMLSTPYVVSQLVSFYSIVNFFHIP